VTDLVNSVNAYMHWQSLIDQGMMIFRVFRHKVRVSMEHGHLAGDNDTVPCRRYLLISLCTELSVRGPTKSLLATAVTCISPYSLLNTKCTVFGVVKLSMLLLTTTVSCISLSPLLNTKCTVSVVLVNHTMYRA
jgi:hypothetical protein